MNKLIFAVVVFLASCSTQTTQFHKTDPVDFCGKFNSCFQSRQMTMPQEMSNACNTIARMDDPWRDACVDNCKDLPPCAFVVCMEIHMKARINAVDMTNGI